jgi:UDP-glucose 4-epimerase
MILITGGMGFIGLHTARRILDAGEDVLLTHFRVRREPDFLKDEWGKRVRVEPLDVTDAQGLAHLAGRYPIKGIVHLVVPGLAELSPAEDYRVNMSGLLHVLEGGRRAGVKRITLASSIAVYAGLPSGPYREDAPLPMESRNATEAFKKAWEVLALHYADRTGVEVVCMRINGIYGPLYHSMANLPSRMCHAAASGVPADFTGARGGIPFAEDEADLCYVKDCARAIQLLQMADRLPHRIYNIGGGKAVKHRELADAVKKVVPHAKIDLQAGNSPRARKDPFLDLGRISADVGYHPEYDVERGAADYISWLQTHPA